ncbi:TrmH family RNA methyltransferase [Stieleria varia]|uniref:Putative TrmH family tRNA/rRNA methyltransferase n=1 Tax=Stieleria varia TaxID=2528005 RepID=A0A5C6APS4_9BACT|nr:TrmH family RNA methyltransferase [Stieleria varia]TWU01076.1 putative TrmH family tRNA/rRNA methyltransferase [Stieleria varia]
MGEVLRSHANPTIKHLIRMRDNRTRRREKRVLVDGWRETLRALEGGLDLIGLYVAAESGDPGGQRPNQQVLEQLGRPRGEKVLADGVMRFVSDDLLNKISYGQSSRGVVSEFQQPECGLAGLAERLPPAPLILVLDGLEKPGNIGAVFRCADAVGVDAVILSGNGADAFNPNAIRNSLGAVFTVPHAQAQDEELEAFFVSGGFRVLAARVESSQSLWTVDWSGPLAILLGSESQGLAQRWKTVGGQAVSGVRIPMNGHVDSLNVSVSAAVIAYEAMRNRSET